MSVGSMTEEWHGKGCNFQVSWNYRHCVCTTPRTEDYTAWAVAMVRTMLSAATTVQFLCLAGAPRDRASNTCDWPFGTDHTISRRTPDPSSRPPEPFLHLDGRESTLDPQNEKTASSLDPVKREGHYVMYHHVRKDAPESYTSTRSIFKPNNLRLVLLLCNLLSLSNFLGQGFFTWVCLSHHIQIDMILLIPFTLILFFSFPPFFLFLVCLQNPKNYTAWEVLSSEVTCQFPDVIPRTSRYCSFLGLGMNNI